MGNRLTQPEDPVDITDINLVTPEVSQLGPISSQRMDSDNIREQQAVEASSRDTIMKEAMQTSEYQNLMKTKGQHKEQLQNIRNVMQSKIKSDPQAREITKRYKVVHQLQRNLTLIGRDLEYQLAGYENAKRPTASLIPNFLDNVYRKAANSSAGIGSDSSDFGNVDSNDNNDNSQEIDSEYGLGPNGPSSSSSISNNNLSWGDLSEIAMRILQATPSTHDINRNDYFGEEIEDNDTWTAKMAEHHDTLRTRIEQLHKITNLSLYKKYDTLF